MHDKCNANTQNYKKTASLFSKNVCASADVNTLRKSKPVGTCTLFVLVC